MSLKRFGSSFAHWDEVELSWQYVQPILDAFEEDSVPLHQYPAGSNGPEASDQLLAEDGFKWWLDTQPEVVKEEEKVLVGQS
ncbi:hypothetical protein CPT76_27625 [Paenibacillus sp. AR247]|nr:hypothetical protein CPT76_27625 [Paenibacillus sp. AR247]